MDTYKDHHVQHYRRIALYLMLGVWAILSTIPSVILIHNTWHDYLIQHAKQLPSTFILMRDYTNIWMGQHLYAQGNLSIIFDPLAYKVATEQYIQYPQLFTWSYPPTVLMLSAPFGRLPALAGMIAYTLTGIIMGTCILRRIGLPWRYIPWLWISPASIECISAGQNGWFTAGWIMGAIGLSSPWARGACAALLGIKPQCTLTIPITWIMQRRWWDTIWTATIGMILIGASILCYGFTPWYDWIHKVGPFMHHIMARIFAPHAHNLYSHMAATPYAYARWLGYTVPQSLHIQGPCSIIGIGIIAWAWWHRLEGQGGNIHRWLAIAMVGAMAPLITPYAYNYDCIPTAIAVSILWYQRQAIRLPIYAYPIMAIAWSAPGATVLSTLMGLYPLITPAEILLVALIAIQIRTARTGTSTAMAHDGLKIRERERVRDQEPVDVEHIPV